MQLQTKAALATLALIAVGFITLLKPARRKRCSYDRSFLVMDGRGQHAQLTELARQQGIPRECAQAFWHTRQRRNAKRPNANQASDAQVLTQKPKPAA